jgi:hypothetical protein
MPGPKIVIVDLGEDLSSVWSPTRGSVTEASRIALDGDGRVAGFGVDADLVAGRRHRGLTVRTPRQLGVVQPGALGAFLGWLFRRAGLAHLDGGAVLLPLSTGLGPAERGLWCDIVADLGGEPLVTHRPVAAALEIYASSARLRAHLMIEISEDSVDVDVVAEGCVVSSRHVPHRDYKAVGRAVNELLATLDPDDEIDIREEGMNLYGYTARRDALAVLASVDIPLASRVGSGLTVLAGAKVMADETAPWLTRVRL